MTAKIKPTEPKLLTGVVDYLAMLNNWVWEHLLRRTGKPYTEIEIAKNIYERHFSRYTKPKHLKWHMDDEDRLITCKYPTNWKIQLENQLPVSLDKPIFIERHQWHRLIKGEGSLILKIKKHAKRA